MVLLMRNRVKGHVTGQPHLSIPAVLEEKKMTESTGVYTVRLGPDLRAKLNTLANADSRKPASLLRLLIKRAWVEHQAQENQAGHSPSDQTFVREDGMREVPNE